MNLLLREKNRELPHLRSWSLKEAQLVGGGVDNEGGWSEECMVM